MAGNKQIVRDSWLHEKVVTFDTFDVKLSHSICTETYGSKALI